MCRFVDANHVQCFLGEDILITHIVIRIRTFICFCVTFTSFPPYRRSHKMNKRSAQRIEIIHWVVVDVVLFRVTFRWVIFFFSLKICLFNRISLLAHPLIARTYDM